MFNRGKKADNQVVKIQQLEKKIKELENTTAYRGVPTTTILAKKFVATSKPAVLANPSIDSVSAQPVINTITSTTKGTVSTTSLTINNGILCNGKYWAKCKNDEVFYCPSNGDAQCNMSPSQKELLLKMSEIIAEQKAGEQRRRDEEQRISLERLRIETLQKLSQERATTTTQPVIIQAPIVDCYQYRRELDILQEDLADRGMTFSGRANSLINDLQEKYPGCQ